MNQKKNEEVPNGGSERIQGKVVELFLVNGTADSLIKAELDNWNGKLIKIPRTEVTSSKVSSMEDINSAGIYFLICKEDDGKDSVYIGEAVNVLKRLKQHLNSYKCGKDKYYWNTAIIFIGDLDKAQNQYLENRFVGIALNSERYKVLTENTCQEVSLKETQITTAEKFIVNAKILLNALGYKILVPVSQANNKTTFLFCKSSKSKAEAKGYSSSEGFIVSKGSTISNSTSKNEKYESYSKLRNKLIQDGIIDKNVFIKDYIFDSPSAASSVILGRVSSGNEDWKTKDRKKLKKLGITPKTPLKSSKNSL